MKICKVFKVLTEAVALLLSWRVTGRANKPFTNSFFRLRSHLAKTNKKTETNTNTETNKMTEKNTNTEINQKKATKHKRRHKCNKPLTNSSLWLRSHRQGQSASRQLVLIKRTISPWPPDPRKYIKMFQKWIFLLVYRGKFNKGGFQIYCWYRRSPAPSISRRKCFIGYLFSNNLNLFQSD